MQTRIKVEHTEPIAFSAMLGLEKYMQNSFLPPLLLELIKVRASVLNGCACCIDMHTQEALNKGEDNRRLFALAA